MESENFEKINIRPGVRILSVLSHLNYKPWFAIAEFIDNSIQSYIDHKEELFKESKNYKLRIDIEIDGTEQNQRIVIKDNAAGIYEKDYKRAFRPAEIPPNREGLSEFGMGMKSAACWFASDWTVNSIALNENTEVNVNFNLENIVNDNIEELVLSKRNVRSISHYTRIELNKLHNPIQSRTKGKIKDHLASIYREFLRSGEIIIIFCGDSLSFEDPKILEAPHYRDLKGPKQKWYKEIIFDFGKNQKVTGFAAIREIAKTTGENGFALFRRKRLIAGSLEESYRPKEIFGQPNDYPSQRLFGELHLEGFDVSHTKDGFIWDENEEPFLELLKEHLNREPLPLIRQTREHRVYGKDLTKGTTKATESTVDDINKNLPSYIDNTYNPVNSKEDTENKKEETLTEIILFDKKIEIDFKGLKWLIRVINTNEQNDYDWLRLDYKKNETGKYHKEITISISHAHPFMENYSGFSAKEIEPILRLGTAIGLAEVVSKDLNSKDLSSLRRNINEILRQVFSKPEIK
jgi:hypothetical protein